MKARYLKALLGTKRPVSDDGESVCVGSYYVHDLISVNKKTLRLRYAMGFPGKGRESLDDEELLAIWDKLQALIDSGEIKTIIEENDVIVNPIPVFTYDRDYNVIETKTDALGWPNTTIDGKLMYTNMYFDKIDDARRAAIREAKSSLDIHIERSSEYKEKLERINDRIAITGKAIMTISRDLILEGRQG